MLHKYLLTIVKMYDLFDIDPVALPVQAKKYRNRIYAIVADDIYYEERRKLRRIVLNDSTIKWTDY